MKSVSSRLSAGDRREQLLNTAADIVGDGGHTALTMERLAQRAGVSKALPYLHFENASAVMAALYRREAVAVADQVRDAVVHIADPEERVRIAVHEYLAAMERHGVVLGLFTGASTTLAMRSDPAHRAGVQLVADLLVQPFGISGDRGRIVASVFLSALGTATDIWTSGDATRAAVEDVLVSMLVGALRTAQEAEAKRLGASQRKDPDGSAFD